MPPDLRLVMGPTLAAHVLLMCREPENGLDVLHPGVPHALVCSICSIPLVAR